MLEDSRSERKASMHGRNKILNVFLALLLAMVVAGCGNAASSPSLGSAESGDAARNAVEDGDVASKDASNDPSAPTAQLDAPEKMVYTADVSLSTREFDKASEEIDAKLKEAGAITFGDNTQQTDTSRHTTRTRQLTVRVASKGLKDLVKSISEMGSVKVTSSNVYATDRTKEYNDSERRIELLKQEYDFYEQTVKETNDPETRLVYTDRMFQLLDEIKSLENTKSQIDEDVAYSQLNITLSEDTALSDQGGNAALWQEIQDAFVMIPSSIAAAFGYLLLFLIHVLPLLVIAGLIAVIVVLVVRRSKARRKKRAEPDEPGAPTNPLEK